MDNNDKARNRELSAGLLRQRRNLLISSAAMVILVVLGFELQEIRLLGNVAKVNNPHFVPIIIFVVHAYSILRYWQYYLEENHIPKISAVIGRSIESYETNYLNNLAQVELYKLHPFEWVNYSIPRHSLPHPQKPLEPIKDKNVSLFSKTVCIHAQIYSDDIDEVFIKEQDKYTFKKADQGQALWKIIEPTDDQHSGVFVEAWVTVNRPTFFQFRLNACTKYIIKQSYFTDYQLPLLIAFASLAIGLSVYFCGNWI